MLTARQSKFNSEYALAAKWKTSHWQNTRGCADVANSMLDKFHTQGISIRLVYN